MKSISIVVLRNPLRYVVTTEAGTGLYSCFDSLPPICKDFLRTTFDKALSIDDVVSVGNLHVSDNDGVIL